MSRWKSRLSAVLAGVAVLAMLGAVPAAAHVTVNPETALKGDYAKLTFRVPNETDNASTTKLEVAFPTEYPLSSVSVKPHPGWSYEIETEKLDQPIDQGEGEEPLTETVRTITWTADDKAAAIAPGEFDEFEVSAGPLPSDTDEMTFKAIQTYDNGEVVRWIEVAAPGAGEPEYPAPVLSLTSPAGEQQAAPVAAQTETGQPASATAALVLSIIALVLGGAGLATGLLARRHRS